MKHQSLVIVSVLLFVLALMPTSASAASLTAMGTSFTYQGRLVDGGTPANGNYDFEFMLWDALAGGAQLGGTVAQTIGVTNGYFTTLLDFGQVFDGEARYLEIGVRPGGTSGAYTLLSPRQALTPVPYALALPGLWTQQNATSPNLIGGYSGNVVDPGLVGATVGGGGRSDSLNIVNDNYGTIAGGIGNRAGSGNGDPDDGAYATVGGGNGNLAFGNYATVGGGLLNNATASGATVAGGIHSTARSNVSSVGGGQDNTASNDWATVAGGYTNVASGSGATVGGGGENIAAGSIATVGGGQYNHATGSNATVPGGGSNRAAGDFSFAAGRRAKANHPGAFVWGDSTDADVASTANDQFVVRATGGVNVTAGTGIWRLEPNPTSPNLIGGYSGNQVATEVHGATISGGGTSEEPNQVISNFGTVSGGLGNTARFVSVVGGGADNTAAGNWSFIGGGSLNSISPNATNSTICGGSRNQVQASGATIGGGMPADADLNTGNVVADDYGTIGGGSGNRAGDADGTQTNQTFATVGGGWGNHALASFATIAGGGLLDVADLNSGNRVFDDYGTIGGGGFNWVGVDEGDTSNQRYATIGGGSRNRSGSVGATVSGGAINSASGEYATVGGGTSNVATDTGTTISGGVSNSAFDDYGTVGGGSGNTAGDPLDYQSREGATVSGGFTNQATGRVATIGGGAGNIASGQYATIPGGYGAVASLWGQMAYASSIFQHQGDAQMSTYVLRRYTEDATPKELRLDGVYAPLTVNLGRAMVFDGLVVGLAVTGSTTYSAAGYQIQGVIKNVTGTASLVGTPVITPLGEDIPAWHVNIAASGDALAIRVTGAADTTVRWVATVRTAEVAW